MKTTKKKIKLIIEKTDTGFLADKIGMNPTLLSQYIQGHKHPSDTQAEKILYDIHEIGQELSEIILIYRR